MQRIRAFALSLALFGTGACQSPSPPDHSIASASVVARPSFTPRSGSTPTLATAVRVLSHNPADVVITPADVPPGFAVGAEYPTSRVDLWLAQPRPVRTSTRRALTTSRQDTAIGLHLLLTRVD